MAFLIVPSEFSLKNLAVVFLIIFYFVIASSPTDGETFIDDEMDSTYAKYDNWVLQIVKLTHENKLLLRLFRSLKYINNSIKLEKK